MSLFLRLDMEQRRAAQQPKPPTRARLDALRRWNAGNTGSRQEVQGYILAVDCIAIRS